MIGLCLSFQIHTQVILQTRQKTIPLKDLNRDIVDDSQVVLFTCEFVLVTGVKCMNIISFYKYITYQYNMNKETKRTISGFETTISLSQNNQVLSFFCQNADKHICLFAEFSYQALCEKQKQYVDNVAEFFVLVKEVSNEAIKIEQNLLTFDVQFGSLTRTMTATLTLVPQIIAKKLIGLEVALKQITEEKKALQLKCSQLEESITKLQNDQQQKQTCNVVPKIKKQQKTVTGLSGKSTGASLFGNASYNSSTSRSVTGGLHHSNYQDRDQNGRFC